MKTTAVVFGIALALSAGGCDSRPNKPGDDTAPGKPASVEPLHISFEGVSLLRREKGVLQLRIIPRLPNGELSIPRDLQGDRELVDTLKTHFTWPKDIGTPASSASSLPTLEGGGCVEHIEFGGGARAACSKDGCDKSCGSGMAISGPGKGVRFEMRDAPIDIFREMRDLDIGWAAIGCKCK